MKATQLLSFSAAVAAIVLSSQAYAGASANVAVGSNYIWRGVTQTNDAAAVSGGLDYEAASGLYVGTWASNLAHSQYEVDLYGGYGGKAGNFGYDAGVIHYAYPLGDNDLDFTELTLSGSQGPLEGGVAYTFNADDDTQEGNVYYHVGVSKDLPSGTALSGTFGHYDFDADGADDYNHFQLGLGKDDFTFAIDKTDLDGAAGDPRVSVSWSKSFDL